MSDSAASIDPIPAGAEVRYVATLLLADRDTAERAAAGLNDLIDPAPEALTLFEQPTASGILWQINAYFPAAPDGAALARNLADLIERPGALAPFIVAAVPDINWVAVSQAALPPVAAGRFVVHGSHDAVKVPQGPNAILIDAGEAFGTAHHQTTAGCLMAIDRLSRARRHRTVLDLGCGSGVLAIAVARVLPHATILASDMDEPSVAVARENMRRNGVLSRVRCLVASGLAHPAVRAAAPYDLVIANILAKPLIALAADLSAGVAQAGTLVLSGLLTPQAPQIIAVYRAHGFRLERHDRISGWSTLTLTRL